MRDGDRRQAIRAAQPVDKLHLSSGIAAVPFRLDINRAFDPIAFGIAAVVAWQIIFSNRGVISVAKRNHRLILQPWIPVAADIPEVLMRIADGKGRHLVNVASKNDTRK